MIILANAQIKPSDLFEQTGWEIKPQGACKEERCVPLPPGTVVDNRQGRHVDLNLFARAMNMPLVHDDRSGLWALGSEAGGKALTSVQAPDFTLPDIVTGTPFQFSSLRGKKVLVVAWASW